VGVAYRLALAAPQAILDVGIERIQFAGFENNGLLLHQPQRRRVGVVQPRSFHQFAGVEYFLRVHFEFVFGKRLYRGLVQVADFGDAYAVLAGDNPTQGFGNRHDSIHHLVGFMQHIVVVRMHRNIGVNVAVTGMHVGGHKHAAATYVFMNAVQGVTDFFQLSPGEYFFQRPFDAATVGDAQAAALQ